MVEFAGPAVFVGRAPELARIEAAARRVRDGTSATLVIGGEAGVGKTRLIEHALAAPRAMGATIMAGACLAFGEAAVPYAPLIAAFRDLTRSVEPAEVPALIGPARAELAHLVPELASREPAGPSAVSGPAAESFRVAGDPGERDRSARARLFEAVLSVVERLTRRSPVVLVVEDLQWSDAATRDLLRYLVGGLRRAPLLTLLSVRTDDLIGEHPILAWLAELERDGAEHLELGPLDRAEVDTLAEALLHAAIPRSLTERLLERTDGNPFFVEALVGRAIAAREGTGELASQAALGAVLDAPLPPGLREILAVRVAELDGTTADVVRAAALAGSRLDDTLLANVLGSPVRTVAAALREAMERGVLVARRGRDGIESYAFRHALVREVVRDQLGPGERRELHAAFARELDALVGAARPPAAELAAHWDGAGDARRALPAFVEAARSAERVFAFEAVLRAARRALELWPQVADPERLVSVDRVGLLDRCAHAAGLLGDLDPALRDARAALAEAEAAGDRHRAELLHERLRWILWERGDRAAALAEVEAAMEHLPEDPPTPARARALAHLAGLRMFAGDLDGSRIAAEEAIDLARRVGGHAEEAIGLGVLGWDMALSGDVEAGLDAFRRAIAIAEALGSVEGIGLGRTNLAALLDRIGRPSEALDVCLDGIAQTRRLGVERSYGNLLRGSAAKALFALGRWDEAERMTDEGLDLDPAGRAAIWLHVNRARSDACRGRMEAAAEHLETARRLDDATGGTEYRPALLAAVAERAVWAGDVTSARDAVDEGFELGADDAVPDPGLAWLAALGLRAEADAADVARARHDDAGLALATDRARRIAARLPPPERIPPAAWEGRGLAILSLCGAELARLDGPDGADPAAWEDAAEAWEAVERPFPAAYCRARQGEALLASRGSREAARSAFAMARETAVRLGAAPLLAEIDLLARQARLDLTRTSAPAGAESRPTPATEAEALGLTARELEVLKLVAGGWSNQQIADALFITRKTASVHVSNILGKLGVSGRTEAAAIAHRLGLGRDAPPPPDSDAVA